MLECRACRYWAGTPADRESRTNAAACVRHAPGPHSIDQSALARWACWPLTYANNGCGDWAMVDGAVTVSRAPRPPDGA